jgi:predicted GNAT family acetyltransferase
VGVDVTDATDRRRYEARIDGELAGIAEYRASDHVVTFVHTEVMSAFEGKGVGSALVRGALDDVRAQGKKVRAVCPFVKGYVEKHSDEYGDLLVAPAVE